MLMYGVIPQVSSATTSMNSLLNSLSIVLVDLYNDDFHAASAVPLFFVGFLGGISGRKVGLYISNVYGRSSILILSLAIVLYLSCVFYIYELNSDPFKSSINKLC